MVMVVVSLVTSSNGDGVLVVCSRDDGDGGCNDESGDNRGATTVSGVKRN